MPIFDPHPFDPTAFMSGQVMSKTWLCRELEPHLKTDDVIWILGGWYGMTSFLLQTRERKQIGKVLSFDQDPEAVKGALILNETFLHLGRFDAHLADVNSLDYAAWGKAPDVVINTSVEHMPDQTWFDLIPSGTIVVLQSNDMDHSDHVFNHNSVEELQQDFPMEQFLFTGHLQFDYGEWAFRRFMTIGVK